MGTDTKIYLNPHAKTEDVFHVILKIVGTDFKNVYKNSEKEDDSWIIRPDKSQTKITFGNSSYFTFHFQDLTKTKHSVMYFFDSYDNPYLDNAKILNPSSTALWGAIGKRLVDFFGGKVLFSDSADTETPNNWHINNNPTYPQKTSNQSSDDRFLQFQKALLNEPILTSKEILAMQDKVAYNLYDYEKKLIDYLEKYEKTVLLDKKLTPKQEPTTPKKNKI